MPTSSDLDPELALKATGLAKSYELGQLLSLNRTMRRLTRRRGAPRSPFMALQDVSFEVRRGECFSLLGSNGSGKSTILQIIAGITLPTAGELRLRGRVLPLFEIGQAFQPELTGRENVILFGTILGIPRKEILSAMDEVAAFAGVEDHMDSPVKRYSLGMIARLSFAISMRFSADVYIFDEVLAVVDDEFQQRCLREMRALVNAGRTVLFVSHNIHVVKAISDRGLWINRGRVQAIGPIEEVAEQYSRSNEIEPTDRVARAQELAR